MEGVLAALPVPSWGYCSSMPLGLGLGPGCCGRGGVVGKQEEEGGLGRAWGRVLLGDAASGGN